MLLSMVHPIKARCRPSGEGRPKDCSASVLLPQDVCGALQIHTFAAACCNGFMQARAAPESFSESPSKPQSGMTVSTTGRSALVSYISR
jgi:hypothetical protein